MKKLLTTISVITALLSNVTFAQSDLSVTLDDKHITVKGTGELYDGELVSIMCNEKEDASGTPVFIDASKAKNNSFSLEFDIPDAVNGGKYYLFANAEGYAANTYFTYLNKEKISNVIDKINGAKTKEELGVIISGSDIDIDAEIYNIEPNQANAVLYRERGLGFTVDTFAEALDKAYFAVLIRNGKSDEAFKRFSGCLSDTELTQKYTKLNNIKYFEQGFKEFDLTKQGVDDICHMAMIYENVLSASDWHTVKDSILDSDTSTPSEKAEKYFDFSFYNRIKDKNSVFQKMSEKIKNNSSFEELKTLFENTARNVYDNENKSTPSGSSGSGGSSNLLGTYGDIEKISEEKNPEMTFSDIFGHWAFDSIKNLFERKIVNGYEDNTFRPNGNVTRAELTKMICMAFDIPTNGKACEFDDVEDSAWYYSYVSGAYNAGVINGVGNNKFSPTGLVTREDASVMFYRVLNSIYPMEKGAVSFVDKGNISDYAIEAVGAMKQEGIIQGTGKNKFEPKKYLTRAECCTLIGKCLIRYEALQ